MPPHHCPGCTCARAHAQSHWPPSLATVLAVLSFAVAVALGVWAPIQWQQSNAITRRNDQFNVINACIANQAWQNRPFCIAAMKAAETIMPRQVEFFGAERVGLPMASAEHLK